VKIGIFENEGLEYLRVYCKKLNSTALRIWNKYFDKYTYSNIRRIDVRVRL